MANDMEHGIQFSVEQFDVYVGIYVGLSPFPVIMANEASDCMLKMEKILGVTTGKGEFSQNLPSILPWILHWTWNVEMFNSGRDSPSNEANDFWWFLVLQTV